MDFFTQNDILTDINSINDILATDIFAPKNAHNPLVRPAFISLLIHLRDLMYKTDKYSQRIDFTDDVITTSDIRDVTDLIKYVRDALCHPDSPNHYLIKGNVKATFMISYGKCHLLSIGNINIFSEYDDDICFCFGEYRIYFNRHIIRAFNEAKQRLSPLLPPSFQNKL